MKSKPPPQPRKGRGAVGNPPGRYEPRAAQPVDDGWWQDDALPPLRTTVINEAPRR